MNTNGNHNGNGRQFVRPLNGRTPPALAAPSPRLPTPEPKSAPPQPLKGGMKMTTKIKQILMKRERVKLPDGRLIQVSNFDLAAEAYVDQMKKGSFIHHKEFMDRTEGKVPTRLADADGGRLKMYVGMPVDDDPNAP